MTSGSIDKKIAEIESKFEEINKKRQNDLIELYQLQGAHALLLEMKKDNEREYQDNGQ